MSAIVIKWRHKTRGYEHCALYLNQTDMYISAYEPQNEERKVKRFSSQTLEDDLKNCEMVDYAVLPSLEDGNKFGIAEGVIKAHWKEIYDFKKNPHETYTSSLKRPSSQNESGEKAALQELSGEFKKFKSHFLFSNPDLLDCTKFVAKLLQKGGMNLYAQAKKLDGYIGVDEMIGIAKSAAKQISAALGGKAMIKDPRQDKRFSKNLQSETYADKRITRL